MDLASLSKYSDTDYDDYYITLRFYLTKTYDKYSDEQRHSANPSIYFNIKDLTTNETYYSTFSDLKMNYISDISTIGLNREGDTKVVEWKSKNYSLKLNSTHEYMIVIMDSDEASIN